MKQYFQSFNKYSTERPLLGAITATHQFLTLVSKEHSLKSKIWGGGGLLNLGRVPEDGANESLFFQTPREFVLE
jgi:hypothetical protein